MKKRQIQIIIILITLACLGLIIIQYYWVQNAYDIQKKSFRESVNKILMQVANEVEKNELQNLFAVDLQTNVDSLSYSYFIQIDDSTNFAKVSVQNQLIRSKNFSAQRRKRAAISTLIRSEKRMNKDSTKSFNFSFLNTQEEDIKVLPFHLGLDSQKQKFKLRPFPYRVSAPKNIRDRINPESIDSLISIYFSEQSIDLDYRFWVNYASKDLNYRFEKTSISSGEASKEVYKVRLFPNDLVFANAYLSLSFRGQDFFILKKIIFPIIISVLLILIIISCFTIAIQTIFRQKKLSDLKNDFINNMTHELKTPISSIALAAEGLSKATVSKDRIIKYSGIVKDENRRLAKHVDQILQMAIIERDQLSLNIEKIDIHNLLEQLLDRFSIQIESANGKLSKQLEAVYSTINGDKLHLSNIFYNLLDNAVKYSNETLQLTVKTWNENEAIFISISDTGIGMTKEQIKHAFEKFYRAQRGNIHDVKGFGLGLAYVYAMVKKLNAEIRIESILEEGTRVDLEFPLSEG